MLKTITVNLTPAYPIHIGTDLLHSDLLVNHCRTQAKTFIIITHNNLVSVYAEPLKNFLQQHFKVHILSFPAGEDNKSREIKQSLEDQMLAAGYGRDCCIIALGGGIVSDMAGFIAATYCRGIPAIYLPTTLLAMVDASIGGKTGVNTIYGKNLIGAFSQPKAVFSNMNFLASLPEREFKGGLVEIIKHTLIADAAAFAQLHTNLVTADQPDLLAEIIYKSCDIKRRIVEADETEQGERQLLNFGHTIGHALEAVSNYTMTHGEAVAVGIAVESYISHKLGLLSADAFKKILAIFDQYKISLKLDAKYFEKTAIKNKLRLDKKAKASEPYFVLLEDIGKPHVGQHGYSMPIDEQLLDAAIAWSLRC